MSKQLVIPEDFQGEIPMHAADLGWWLRENGVQEDIIAILVGKFGEARAFIRINLTSLMYLVYFSLMDRQTSRCEKRMG